MSGNGDYISREAAIEAMYKDAEAHPDHTFWTSQHEALRNIPAADVRPVVLCRDCRHRDPEDRKCDSGETERQGCPFPVHDDYFCAYGEASDG